MVEAVTVELGQSQSPTSQRHSTGSVQEAPRLQPPVCGIDRAGLPKLG